MPRGSAKSGNSAATCPELGQRNAHVRPRRVVPDLVGPAPNAKRPREREAFLAQRVVRGCSLASPNLPRSVFTNRASFPLAFISRNIAE